MAGELLNDAGDNCPLIPSEFVLQTARQEARDKSINLSQYPGDPISSILKMMDNKPGILKTSTIPFYIQYWTNNQIRLWKEAFEEGAFISIDASGGFIKLPYIYGNNKPPSTFLYTIVTNIGRKICPVSQYLSSVHDARNIFLWLAEWIKSGAPIPKVSVMDCSSALLNASCLAFNGLYYPAYLEKCFDILLGNSKERLPNCLIKRDRAHLLKNIAQLKLFHGDNWIKKDFYLFAIGYLLQISDLKLFEDVAESIFIVCVSQYCGKESECYRRIQWLYQKIGTFDYQNFYSLNTEESSKSTICNEESLNSNGCTEENNFLDYNTLQSELPTESRLKNYIYNIYNKAVKKCDIENSDSTPNAYYLPKLADYFIVIFFQFLAWTNVLHPLFGVIIEIITSARSECHFKIKKHDYGMNQITSCNRFLLKDLNDIDGGTKLGLNELKALKLAEVEKSSEIVGVNEKSKKKYVKFE